MKATLSSVTARVTEIFRLLAAWMEVRLMVPVYEPALSPVGLTETFSVTVLAPLEGATESQFPPELVDAVMLMLAPVAVTVSV